MLFALAFLAGLISATGFAPLDLWPLLLIAFAALIRLLGRMTRLGSAAAIGWCFGFGQFVLGLNWIATAFTFQAAMPAWLGWIAVVLLSIYLAVFPAVATAAAWWVAKRLGGGTIMLTLLTGSAWIINELLRATVFTGFAWNPVGVLWLHLPSAQAARWIGTYGLSGLAVLSGGGLLLLVERRWKVGILLTAPLWIGAAVALLLPLPVSPSDPARTIHIVQPNINQDAKYDPAHERENVARLFRLSGKPGPEPRLLLWPEAAVPAYLELDPDSRRSLATLLGPRDMLLLGAESLQFEGGKVVAARNSLFGLDPAARLTGRYDKAHLVPYGEYLPMRPLLSAIGLSRLAPGDMDFLAGPGPRTLAVPGFGLIGGQICYEIVFSGQVIDAKRRPGMLFNPSNDAWFGRWGPPQHLAQARLRAIEEAMPIARSTPTGISAVIDTRGRLLASLPWHSAGAIDAALPRAEAPTLFARFGNWLPIGLALLLAALAVALSRRERYRA